MFSVTLASIAVNFVSVENRPMLFESVGIRLQIAYTLEKLVLFLRSWTETFDDFIVLAYCISCISGRLRSLAFCIPRTTSLRHRRYRFTCVLGTNWSRSMTVERGIS